jgi:hypothetical protein
MWIRPGSGLLCPAVAGSNNLQESTLIQLFTRLVTAVVGEALAARIGTGERLHSPFERNMFFFLLYSLLNFTCVKLYVYYSNTALQQWKISPAAGGSFHGHASFHALITFSAVYVPA